MRLALAVTVLVAGCRKDVPHATEGSGSAKPAIAPVEAPDAAIPVDALADPDPDRRGKRTGLTAGELPEVATEDLVRAIAAGNVPLSAFIDPKRGVYHKEDMPGAGDKPGPVIAKRECGAAANKVALAYIKRMVAAEVSGHRATADESVHGLQCTNAFITKPDPKFGSLEDFEPPAPGFPMRYAICESPHIMEWDEGFFLVFTPDPTRGLALAAIVSIEGGMISEKIWAQVAKNLASPKGC